MKKLLCIALVAAAAPLVGGCRGSIGKAPPVHLIGDMDWQQKALPQSESKMFADRRSMRPLPDGTVARGELREDDAFFTGQVAPASLRDRPDAPALDLSGGKSAMLAKIPVPVDDKLVKRGQDRYNIFCAPCHDQSGAGRGTVVQRGYPIPVDLNGDRVRTAPDGYLFDVISHGVRNMPAYALQVPPADRWAIVAWVRVLNRSQAGKLVDVPESERGRIQPEGSIK